MGTFDALYASLNPNQQQRGFEFEHVCKWFLENDPKYTSRLKRVWLWKEWPGRWSDIDTGIDLVAEETDGKLWAIQAKSYREDRKIPKEELNKFLSESNRREFTYRLLITTTSEGLHHIAAKTVSAQEKPVLIVDLPDLRDSPVSWPGSLADLRPAPPREPAEPREHQAAAILDVLGGFESHDRGQLLMACGTGKTLTAWFLREKLDAQRTLVLVPSLSLLKQTMHEWERAAGGCAPFTTLPVCSDSSVRNTDDPAVAFTAELGVPVTTDPEMIAKFLRGRGPRVVFSTYQSSPQVAEAFTLPRVPAFDLVIADEAHRVAGDESSVFATILNPDAIKARRRLFMTATPRYFTGRVIKKAQESDEMVVASMDDHTKFGEVFHKLSFGEAISRGLLTDYQVAVIGVDSHDPTYREWADKGTLLKRDGKATDGRILASQIGLAKALRTDKYDLRRVISFHSTIARARQFAAELPDVIGWMPKRQRPTGRLWTGVATGEMSAGERHVRLQRLRQLDDDERGLLANARCLSEGVDVPTLDGVAFIDPKGSEVDIIQAVGRAIRLADDKTIGTIVIPVFIDPDQDPAEALSDSSFKAVWRVINALRAHDEELAEQIDSFRRELGRRGGKAQIPDKIHLDVTRDVSKAFSHAFDVRLVEQTSAAWEWWFGLLDRYTAEHGTARIPVDYVMDGRRLGQWASVQRGLAVKGDLSEDRRTKLDALPGWVWDILDDQWGMWMRLMREFVAEHGHANVPYPYMSGEFNLRNFVATQRGLYKRGQLSEERIAELESLPGWVWDALDETWQEHYAALRAFSGREGHACPKLTHEEGALKLGQWISVQRVNRDSMSSDRRELLEALPGWSWNPSEDRWRHKYAALVAFAEREGHARVPKSHREGDVRLGQWISVQRVNRDRLTDEKRGLLEAIPGWNWDARADMWHRKLDLLRQFQMREGHALVKQGHIEDGVKLGVWVLEQRNNEDKISEERRALLESVPGWTWNPYEDVFERGYRALRSFADREGHARVPKEHVEGRVKLGGWVGQQRQSRETMTSERRERLEAVPGWSWDSVLDSWMEHLEALRTYTARVGDSLVPTDHVEGGLKLGQWVRLRRKDEKKLSPERKALLEDIPGWFWGTKSDYIWGQRLELLKKFTAREGHARPSYDHVEDGVKLGSWVVTQRSERNSLSQKRVELLEALPGWAWSVSKDAWMEKYELAQKFAAREGHARVPQSHIEDGVALGSWVGVQRCARAKLTPEQCELLEVLPGWVWRAR